LLAGCGEEKSGALHCYVGGTMRPAMAELARIHEAQTGQAIDLDYADSGQLLIRIQETGVGDLYVCHDPFAGALVRRKLARQIWTVASLTPMIAVPEGNPKNIQGLRDLARPRLRLGLTDPDYSTLGHINPVMFDKAHLREEIEANVDTRKRMGGDVANSVMLGHLEAAIVWNAVIHARRHELDAIDIEPEYRPHPDVDAVTSATFGYIDMSCVKVTIATLGCSKKPKAATAFAEFVNSPRGRMVFAAHDFSPSPYPPATGPLYFYCGAGIRPAVAEVVQAFSAITGAKIECDYAGSETLLGRIKLNKTGDLYMPGDIDYIQRARKEGFIESHREACYFVPVILVRKGNPKGIRTLGDLVRPGIKLGLGDARACAIGRLSEKLFKRNQISLDPQKDVTFASPTVNALGVQIQTGHLDAVVVWDAIAAQYADSGDVVPIPPQQNIISRVAIGVLRSAKQPELAASFVDFLTSKRGRAIFQKHHYTTTLKTP